MDLPVLRDRLSGDFAPPEALPEFPRDAIAAPALSDDAMDLIDGPLRHAAVLVPIIHGPEPGVLLTLRAATLRAHAGQVAFPGGRIDADDGSPEAAALREAQEEIGLRPEDAELMGRLPEYVTGTGFHITPVLALIPAGLAIVPNPDEVASIFILPLATLLDPAAPEQRTRLFRGRQRRFWVWPHEEHYIWGATAAILVQLAARLREQRA